jgi:3',5'-cyclic AMP phosphodiesterase CpdA
MAESLNKLIQLNIIHLSDMHFGDNSICRPEDKTSSSTGFPKLHELLLRDLNGDSWNESVWAVRPSEGGSFAPLIVAATGDFTQKAQQEEFDEAEEFLRGIVGETVIGQKLIHDHIFTIPGNHDVVFNKKDPAHRFSNYCHFYNSFYDGVRSHVLAKNANDLTSLHSVDDYRVVVAEINSCYYVEKDTEDESRGQVDLKALTRLKKQLLELGAERSGWVKIALVHHHPILIPSFVEAGRGVDAVLNARSLLRTLRDSGFQLVLHGHKHNPHVFSFDPEPAWTQGRMAPQLIVAGGSCGSRALPEGKERANTYNLMTIKWNPDTLQARVEVVTRGLVRLGTYEELDPDEWAWKTLRRYDKFLSPYEHIPSPRRAVPTPPPQETDSSEKVRSGRYSDLRLNMPVVEVFPSLKPGQEYEARVWIETHKYHKDTPVKVTWSAGPKFGKKVLDNSYAPDFAASFHYWGSVLIQVEMQFSDGHVAFGHVYARIPKVKSLPNSAVKA